MSLTELLSENDLTSLTERPVLSFKFLILEKKKRIKERKEGKANQTGRQAGKRKQKEGKKKQRKEGSEGYTPTDESGLAPGFWGSSFFSGSHYSFLQLRVL
jgi:hypothetical protein